MKKNTKALLAALLVVVLYLVWSWILAGIFGDNTQTALAALIGVYVIYDINTRKEV